MNNTKRMHGDDERSSSTLAGKSLNTTLCRASFNGCGDLVDCQSEKAPLCRYALSFGAAHYCCHPERLEIAARAKASC